MSNARINPILSFTPARSSTSGYFGNDNSNGSNKDNHNGKSFQDIFKQQLEVESHKSQNTHIPKLNPLVNRPHRY
ncbi:MAG: hypothetical protein ACM3ZR_07610 [Pseudomonadota bacterium]